jgi:DNA adenine methylase
VSRDEFNRLKRAVPDTLTDIQRAARFYYLQQSAFAGKLIGQSFGNAATNKPKLNLLRVEEYLSAAHLRLSRVYVECLPYADVIKRYDKPDTFFYIDPPYWDYEWFYGKGIFSKADFSALAGILEGIKGRFILSLNDMPAVRETFAAFKIDTAATKYTCGKERNITASEVLIQNF